jgi:hypothetical protein
MPFCPFLAQRSLFQGNDAGFVPGALFDGDADVAEEHRRAGLVDLARGDAEDFALRRNDCNAGYNLSAAG